jgi:hypothetical protein
MPTFIFVTEQLDQITDSIDGVATAMDDMTTALVACCDELNTNLEDINTTLAAGNVLLSGLNVTLQNLNVETNSQGVTLDALLTEVTGWQVSRRRTLAFEALQGLLASRFWDTQKNPASYDNLVQVAYDMSDRALLFDP